MIYNTKILQPALDAMYERQYQAMLQRSYLQAMAQLFTVAPSITSENRYAWLGDIPIVKEWNGNKTLGGILDYDYTIRNKDFYTGFTIDRNELEDSAIAAISPRVDSMAMAAAQFPIELVIQLIIDGVTGLAYDGSAFFANRTAPNDNLVDGTGVTLAAMKKDITDARAAMMRFSTDQGRTIGARLTHIVCPPELEGTILEATKAASLVTTGEGALFNPLSGWIEQVISVPELSDTNDWYGFALGMPIKPFIYQQRKTPMPVLDDSHVARDRKIDYSVELRGNAGYAFPQMAIKVVNT
jgi:phage major head subunit gpT-like protein